MDLKIKIGESEKVFINRIKSHFDIDRIATELFKTIKENDDYLNKIDEISESSLIQEKDAIIRKANLEAINQNAMIESLRHEIRSLKHDIEYMRSRINELIKAEEKIKQKYLNGSLLKDVIQEKAAIEKKTVYLVNELKQKIKNLEADIKSNEINHQRLRELESSNKDFQTYFYIQIEDLIHSINLKPGIRGYMSDLAAKYKKMQSNSSPEEFLSELFDKFGYLNKT
jgi:predicted RNase H-like nuclease (RuvC/YqgF family)